MTVTAYSVAKKQNIMDSKTACWKSDENSLTVLWRDVQHSSSAQQESRPRRKKTTCGGNSPTEEPQTQSQSAARATRERHTVSLTSKLLAPGRHMARGHPAQKRNYRGPASATSANADAKEHRHERVQLLAPPANPSIPGLTSWSEAHRHR